MSYLTVEEAQERLERAEDVLALYRRHLPHSEAEVAAMERGVALLRGFLAVAAINGS